MKIQSKEQMGIEPRLFRNIFANKSLFGSDNGTSLFSNLFSQNSIFNQGSIEKKSEDPTSNIGAGSQKTSTPTFGNGSGSLFSNGNLSSGEHGAKLHIGGNTNQGSIFSRQNADAYSKSIGQENDDGEGEEDSA